MLIFPSPSSAMQRSSEENAIESISSGCWMSPSRVRVGVSQNATTRFVEDAMNLPRCGRAIHERCLVLGAGHSERVDLVDVSSCRIFTVGDDEEVFVGPEETGVVRKSYCYWYVHEGAFVIPERNPR